MSNLPAGDLSITVVEARDLTNKDGMFGKNDAYVTMEVGSHKQKTKVIKNAGAKATWNERFTFRVSAGKADLKVKCMDYDLITSDDLIGKINIPLYGIRQYGRMEGWYPIAEDGKYGGEVHLILQFAVKA